MAIDLVTIDLVKGNPHWHRHSWVGVWVLANWIGFCMCPSLGLNNDIISSTGTMAVTGSDHLMIYGECTESCRTHVTLMSVTSSNVWTTSGITGRCYSLR